MTKEKPRGLGRGLKDLLGDDLSFVEMQDASGIGVKELPLSQISPGKYQPRAGMDDEALAELADSIREQGVISPIIVRPLKRGKFEVVAGERRFRAAGLAGLKSVPALVRELDNRAALAVALIENMQREDLNALEQAQGIQRLIDEFGLTHEEAAKAIGRSRSATTNLLRLLRLAAPVRALLAKGELEMGQARALLPLSAAEQAAAAHEIAARTLSARQAEKLVARLLKSKAAGKGRNRARRKSADDRRFEERLSDALGAMVSVTVGRRGKGKIVIPFADLDDLQAIADRIAPED